MYISCLQPQLISTRTSWNRTIQHLNTWPWHTESWVLTCGHVSDIKISQLSGYLWDWDVYSSDLLRHGTIYGLPTMINHQDNGIALCAVHDVSILLHLAWMFILAWLTTLTGPHKLHVSKNSEKSCLCYYGWEEKPIPVGMGIGSQPRPTCSSLRAPVT